MQFHHLARLAAAALAALLTACGGGDPEDDAAAPCADVAHAVQTPGPTDDTRASAPATPARCTAL